MINYGVIFWDKDKIVVIFGKVTRYDSDCKKLS